MASPPPLYNIPAAHRQYATKRVSDPNEPCCACWRNFGEKDDPSDLEEVPCRPLQLEPCRHIVGDQCLREMKYRAMANCPMCRAPLVITRNETSSILDWIANSPQVRECIDITVQCVQELTPSAAYDTLSRRLLIGNFRLADAMELWWIYMCAWLVVALRIGGHWVVSLSLICYGLYMAVVWSLKDTFIVYWQLPTTYWEYFTEAFDHFLMFLEGFAITGCAATMIFGLCVGMLVLTGVE